MIQIKNSFLKHKNKIIALSAAALVLAVSFFAGTSRKSEPNPVLPVNVTASPKPLPTTEAAALPPTPIPSAIPTVTASPSAAPVQTKQTESLPEEQTFSTPKSEEKKSVCKLTVRCDEILKNMDRLNPEKKELIPENGIIFSGEAEINDGESVFTVLQREMKKQKIHMEFVNTPATNSAYIKGINNIYEFDCGGFSGWTYTVNGKMLSVGCSQYILHPGDDVEWKYVCELPDTD